MYLEELIGNVQLENDKFECKSRLNREDVVRRDGFTNGATYEEIIEMSVKSKNTQYDILGIWRGNPRPFYDRVVDKEPVLWTGSGKLLCKNKCNQPIKV